MIPTRYGRLAVEPYRHHPGGGEPCLPSLLDRKLRLGGPQPRRRRPPAVYLEDPVKMPSAPRSLEQATNDLVKYIEANKDQISDVIADLRHSNLGNQEVSCIIKNSFKILDGYVFMNRLHNRVTFHGYTVLNGRHLIGPNDSGKTIATDGASSQNATVILNCDAFDQLLQTLDTSKAFEIIFAAILHQLIHAYFVVACGAQSDEKKANALLTHEEHFGIILHKIKGCSAKQGAPLPLDFGNTMPEVERFPGSRAAAYDTGGLTMRSPMWADDRKLSTECARSVKTLKEEECKDWFRSKCLKTLDPDVYVYNTSSRTFDEKPLSKCGNKGDWVEFTYKKKAYKVPRKAFETSPTFKKKFEDSVRKLDISSEVRKETFEEFVRWLCEDSDDYFTPSLRVCVEVYKLALSLKFEELKEFMLDQMYRGGLAHPTAEAVLEVIRAVYGTPTQPDRDLRTWAEGFMKSIGSLAVRTAMADPRLSRLRGSSGAFRQDLDKVVRELVPTVATLGRVDSAYPTTVGRNVGTPPVAAAIGSYTVNPPPTIVQNPPVQVTTTATQLPGPYASNVAYTQLPYPPPVAAASPIYPTAWTAPTMLPWEEPSAVFLDTIPVAEPISLQRWRSRWG